MSASLALDHDFQLWLCERSRLTGVLNGTTIMPPVTTVNYRCTMEKRRGQASQFRLWLAEQLRVRGWSRSEAARRFAVDASAVSRWLNGDRIPSPDAADRIADALNADVDLVLTLLGHRPPVFEIDPNSPEGKLLPYIRAVDWSKHQRELAMIQRQLEFIVEVDRGEHDRK